MKIKVLFFQGTHFSSKLIRWRTYSEYSHVAIQAGDYIYESVMFKGVIKTRAGKRPESLKKILTFEVSESDYLNGIDYLEKQLGKGYDYYGLLSFFGLPKINKNNNRFWCSEYAVGGLNAFKICKREKFPISPESLFLLLK